MNCRPIAIVVVLFSCCMIGSAGAGDVTLTGTAAHNSLMGVEFSIDGKNDKSYIEDIHPEAEATYRAGFWFNPSGLVLENKTGHIIFEGVGPKPAGAKGDTRVIHIQLWRNNSGVLKVKAYAHQTPGLGLKRVGTKMIKIDDQGWNHLTLEWRATSSNSSPNGLLRLSVDGGSRAGGTSEISGVALNEGLVIEKARIGAVRGVDATTSGSFAIDTFESFRSLTNQ